jgi:GTPase KRas protein
LLVYSIDSRQSFEEIPAFRERILLVNEEGLVPMVLVANKCDLVTKRAVSVEEGKALAQEYGNIPFIECSALKGLNCDHVFHSAVREIRTIDSAKRVDDDKSGGLFDWCTLL